MVAAGHAGSERFRRALEMHKHYLGCVVPEQIAVAALQGRTGNNDAAAVPVACPQGPPDSLEPRPPVFVLQGDACPHLLLVLRRVQVITVDETDTEPSAQQGPNRGFSRTRYAHDDQGPKAVVL